FVRGVPVWATLIGLVEDGQPVIGLVSAPSLSRRWWGGAGVGAWTGSRINAASRLTVSGVDRIEEASLSYSSLGGWADSERLPQMLNLMQRFWRTRAYGDFWSYMLWPRARWTPPANRSSRCTTWSRWSRSSRRRAAASRPSRERTALAAATPWPPTD